MIFKIKNKLQEKYLIYKPMYTREKKNLYRFYFKTLTLYNKITMFSKIT